MVVMKNSLMKDLTSAGTDLNLFEMYLSVSGHYYHWQKAGIGLKRYLAEFRLNIHCVF